MYFEQFYLGCLAHASYMIGSGGEAAIVDPQRDVEIYLKAAQENGLKICHIFETHLHADFVSGHKELAARTGATIYIGEKAGATYPHSAVRDGSDLSFGSCKISVLETPGHTPESICLLITDTDKRSSPWAVLTGDTLFIGDVGRPDLSPVFTPQQLAAMLYDSLHYKLMKLSDDVLVYPAHGAGSLCGRNMRAERSSTIGTERLTNYALQIRTRDEFVRQLTTNLPARPEYFAKDAEINRGGAAALTDLPKLTPITPSTLQALMERGTPALDIRPPEVFAAAHVPGSISIALSGQFASWAGSLLGLSSKPVLVADSVDQVEEARVRLARVGIEDLSGYLQDGMAGWKQAGFQTSTLPQLSPRQLSERHELHVLDVRRDGEWQTAHLEDAQLWPLDRLKDSLPPLDKNTPVAVHCKSGYRSTIACSLLQRAGFTNVMNVAGGFDAWQQEQLPVVAEVAAK
jgi:glyoxylase-like metal-dependent hydrolase (beta-lactamase superfamily II)/rhodanese-related sulfurtransferase